jgi:hypothetical protein
MLFAGVNFWIVLVAAVVAWVFGAVWYNVLSTPWLAAQDKNPKQFQEDMKMRRGTPAFYAPFVLSFVAEFVMAWMLWGIMLHAGAFTIRGGLLSGLLIWFGFVLTTIAVNNAFSGRKIMLSVIDAGHWLGVFLIMGAMIGAFAN